MRATLIRFVLSVSYWLGRILNGPWRRRRSDVSYQRLAKALPEHVSLPSRRTLFLRQALHPVVVLFLFFVIYGLVSFVKDIASLLLK